MFHSVTRIFRTESETVVLKSSSLCLSVSRSKRQNMTRMKQLVMIRGLLYLYKDWLVCLSWCFVVPPSSLLFFSSHFCFTEGLMIIFLRWDTFMFFKTLKVEKIIFTKFLKCNVSTFIQAERKVAKKKWNK